MQRRLPAPPKTFTAIVTALFLGAGLFLSVGSSITHAETADALPAKLSKLGYEPVEPVDQVQNYRVDGWNYIDSKHIMIYAGPSKRFLITTMVDCPDLGSAEHIGFTSTASYITKFDKLIVRGPSGMVQHCPITQIQSLQKIKSK